MRVPDPQAGSPGRRGRRRPGANGKIFLAGLAGVLLLLLVSLRGIAGFYTDYLFFKELGFEDVWRDLIIAKAFPTVVFTAVFFVLVLVNMVIADRVAPRFRPAGPEEELVARYRALVGPYAGRVRLGVALLLALIAGGGLSSHWNEWILFRNRVDFGAADAQFGTDIGFYVFTMPFLRFVFEWTFAALVIVFIVTAVTHYLNGGIRLQGPMQRVTPQVKAHLSVILGAIALLKAFGYWLERYDLNFSTRGAVQGASYTDVKAQLPALNMLIIISIAAAVLLIVNIRLRGWVLPGIAVGLWLFVSVAIGGVYPMVIQRFSVEPNEFQKEKDYIDRNIKATRQSFGLEDVETRVFDPSGDLSAADIEADETTIGDARLWDPEVLDDTYRQLQQIRQGYVFRDVDIDRYTINDEVRQVLLSAREINVDELPNDTWQNRHLVYTHGYGVVASTANDVNNEQEPNFLVKNVPPQSDVFDITQPRFYFGEGLSGFAVVGTKQQEFDYPKEGEDATFAYKGGGGTELSGVFRRAAFALRFGDMKMMISDQIDSDSKVLFVRDIRDRVRKAAPFLRFDADPYPVIIDKRVLWVLDAYTATDRYPYAQSYDPARLSEDSDLRTRLNYVRNSVKATVDAYDGTVRFYVFDNADDPDPIVKAYRKAFPDLFHDRSEMPPGLEEHVRYPEDLFRIQADTYAQYHLTNPTNFYQGSGRWAVAQDPGSGVLAFDSPATQATTRAPVVTAPGRAGAVVEPARRRRMDPYYLLMRLPGQTKESFLILQPFVPAPSGQREPTNLTSFLVAKSDPGEYGELEAYTIPVNTTFDGPEQVHATIVTDPVINEVLTDLTRAGSEVLLGSLQLIPTSDSIIYVRPIYSQSTGATKLPRFRYVAVVYNGEPVIGQTLDEALAKLFPGLDPGAPPPDGETPPPDGETPPPASGDVAGLLAEADKAFSDAQAALREGKLGDYQRLMDRVGVLIGQARAASGGSTTTTTAPSTTTIGPGEQ